MKYMKSIIISDAQYYKQINLSTNRFGDENVLIYPPRKLLYQNMNSMRQKRTMTFVGGYTENVKRYKFNEMLKEWTDFATEIKVQIPSPPFE